MFPLLLRPLRRGIPFLCALLAGLTATLPARAGDLVVAVARSALSLPLHVAESQGFFAAEGVGVRVQDCVTGLRCMGMLFQRSAQFATASELPVMFHSFERSDYAIVATFVTATSNIKLIGRRGAGVTGPEQLAGKRIGLLAGSSSHYFLDSYLLFHGIDPRRTQLVPLPAEKLADALVRKEIDAFAGYNPQVAPALKALGADGIVLQDPRIYTETFNLIADRHTLVQREADVIKMLRALQRAERWIAEQPERAKALMQERLKLDAGAAEALFGACNYRLALDQSLVSTMEGEARWALREGHVTTRQKVPNYLQYVESGPLRAAAPAAFSR